VSRRPKADVDFRLAETGARPLEWSRLVHMRSTARHRIRWTPEESDVVRSCALDWMHGRLETENAAIRAALRALARAGFGGRRTRRGIAYRLELEAERLGRQRVRALWSAAEDRAIDRFALAVVRHECRSVAAASRACQRVLAGYKHAFPRTIPAIFMRIAGRAHALGMKPGRTSFTAEETELLDDLARKVSRGRFRYVRDASRAFVAEMARRRRRARAGRPTPVRTIDGLDKKLWHVARHAGLAWRFRDWSPEEDRIVDRFIKRFSEGRYRSLRVTAKACRAALRRLDASREKRPEGGRPYRRSLLAVRQHLAQRVAELNITRPLFRRWRGAERQLATQCARRFIADRVRRRRKMMLYAVALQIKLRSLGYPRTVDACRAEIGREVQRIRMTL
jgi:hypothetical protein